MRLRVGCRRHRDPNRHGEQTVDALAEPAPTRLTTVSPLHCGAGRGASRSGCSHPPEGGMTIHLGHASPHARATKPTAIRKPETARAHAVPIRPAPGGLPARSVAGPAVRSCRTVSLCLPPTCAGGLFSVYFPWPRRALPGTVFPWSPDFPPPHPFGNCGGGHPASWPASVKVRRRPRQAPADACPAVRSPARPGSFPRRC